MITPERWARLEPIVAGALDLTEAEIPGYLERACQDAPELRADAELLIGASRQADSLNYLESPAAELAAPLLENDELLSVPGDELAPGMQIGEYTIERRLGSGGMGVVYLAHDDRLDRSVALKLLPDRLAAAPAANRRFVQEAQAASRLDHPNIQTVYDVGESADGRRYIAMAHYDGETLQERIARGPLAVPDALDIARQIAAGLAAAHARNIVHRDIKPSNVIVTPEGVVKIVDFGAARIADHQLTVAGLTQGTVSYMSPEQTRGGNVDARTDLWSLGVVLYEMLAGSRPFRRDTQEAVFFAIRHDEPEPLAYHRPELPPTVVQVVQRCLAKDPDQRVATAHELQRELEGLPATRRWPLLRGRHRWTAVAVSLSGLVVLAGLLARGPAPSEVAGPAAAILVIPPLPAGADSALSRLGRELAVTLSANLDGMGGIRTVPAQTVLAQVGERPVSLDEGVRIAQRLGASSVLSGSLVRSGANVRLDLGLFAAADNERIAAASVLAAPEDIAALTDSATILLLRQVWHRGGTPLPSLAANTTRSLPALRAFLEGELAMARGEFGSAVPAFERAFAADSSFGLAYWRSIYPRVYEGSRPDSVILAGILTHRERIPYPERLLADAYVAPTLAEKQAILRAATTRFQHYWPGWYASGDQFVHNGPYVGSTYADARNALERTVALNPDFAVAWTHLLWIAVLQRDTAAADRAIERLERFATPDAFLLNPANMTFFRSLHALLRSGGRFTDDAPARLARAALSATPRIPPGTIATALLTYGFPVAQVQQADAVLRERMPPGMAEAQWMGKALASAVRGAWDSAFVALQHWTRLSDDPQTVLRAYGLATLGVSTGAVAPDAALGWRPDLAQAAAAAEPDGRAELAWLDGVNAFFRGDTAGIARALQELGGSGGRHAELLSASLRAFQRHASGDRAGAARSLAELEWNLTGRGDHLAAARFHPQLSAIHRPAAARWLVEYGDTMQAVRLLTWHEAIVAGDRDRGYGGINSANRVVEPLALQQRARLEEALGRESVAREHYRAFLERYDRAPSAHQGLVADARAALHRLGDAEREVPAGPSRRSPEPRRAPRGEGLPPPAG